MRLIYLFVFSFFLLLSNALSAQSLQLLQNFQRAKPGDYLVTARNKNYTIILVSSQKDRKLVVEEITAPLNKIPKNIESWRQWIESGAYGHTGWIRYELDLNNGQMVSLYSFTHQRWLDTSSADNWLSTLLNLNFQQIPDRERKKTGAASPKKPTFWNPTMVVNGEIIPGVFFEAYRAKWPKDNSELSGKLIEIYLPQDSQLYPSYFPFWLQISGIVGKAKLRMIDTGSNLRSPKSITAAINFQ